MKSKDQEYVEIFLAEALENYEELNVVITRLEKKPDDKPSIDAVFRIIHTLKGNAAGLGFKVLAEYLHVMEDFIGAIKEDKINLTQEVFNKVFKSIDVLGSLINSIKDGSTVKYHGIKATLEVVIRKSKEIQKESRSPKIAEAEEIKPEVSETNPDSAKSKTKPAKKARKEEIENTNKIIPVQEPTEEIEPDKIESVDEASESKITFSDLVQVPVRKLDNLLNLVGELIIERDRLIARNQSVLASNEYSRLNRISSDLQYSVMNVRLVQVGFLFNKFQRVVRDAAMLEQKDVELELKGTETEIDRNILQIISNSLIHIVRNSVGHGIEKPEERLKKGKSKGGTITMSAFSESDAVIIEVKDDGKGIDIEKVRQKAVARGLISAEDIKQLADSDVLLFIFEPGFSTADTINAISGRGVGMDVVKKAMDSIGGSITAYSEKDKGTVFNLKLPSSMAVKGTLLFTLDNQEYAIPLSFTEAVISRYKSKIFKAGNGLVTKYLDKTIPVLFLKDIFEKQPGDNLGSGLLLRSFSQIHPEKKLDIMVISYNGKMVGVVVDKLLQQKEIVEKPLLKPVDHIKLISGVTILGNGHVCLIINVPSLFNMIFSKSSNSGQKISFT